MSTSRPVGSRSRGRRCFKSVDRAGEKLTGRPLTRPVLVGEHSPGACSSRPRRLASRMAAILYWSRLTNWRRQREAGALYQHEVPHGCR